MCYLLPVLECEYQLWSPYSEKLLRKGQAAASFQWSSCPKINSERWPHYGERLRLLKMKCLLHRVAFSDIASYFISISFHLFPGTPRGIKTQSVLCTEPPTPTRWRTRPISCCCERINRKTITYVNSVFYGARRSQLLQKLTWEAPSTMEFR